LAFREGDRRRRWRKQGPSTMADVIEAITKGLIKAPAAADAVAPFGSSSLQAFGRLFVVCASGRCEPMQQPLMQDELLVEEPFRRPAPFDEDSVSEASSSSEAEAEARGEGCAGASALADLASQGPYLLAASFLDAEALLHADATCRSLRESHRANYGAWCSLGTQAFLGLELDGEGTFQPAEPLFPIKHNRLDWKGRYARFLMEMRAFREPFGSAEITQVAQADEIAYSRIRLCAEALTAAPLRGVYIEVEVLANPDNVSLAIVNFDAGGCSSVTFSPDTGAVIRERKVCEEPRKVQGSYIQPLATITQGQGFEGHMGLYLCGGQLAFFRRHLEAGEEGEAELGDWESTGFITNLDWAEGKQLTPCLAFRDEGAYHVRLAALGSEPPLAPERLPAAYEEASWSDLNWDADQEQELEDEDDEEFAEL